jgi:peptide deformylase
MILPVTAYGHPVLRKKATPIDKDYPDLDKFINDLWETMYKTDGVGLAAPQVNRSIRVFAIDAAPFVSNYPEAEGFKKLFINAEILERDGEDLSYQEGCISIPDIHEDVVRKTKVLMRWQDENWEQHEEWIEGINARVVQHEYDHLEGILFTDHLSSLRKMVLKRKLSDIAHGRVNPGYRMLFPQLKRKK